MNIDTQRAKAEAFRAMHDRSKILVLPNAWDPMSARVIEEAGARAIATTSAGVAFSVGYPDGEAMPRDEMIAAIARIARVVTVPLSADIESGFARDAHEVAETVRRVIAAGAVGINLDDAVRRANAYRKAGADCLVVPRIGRPADIERIVAALEGPLNLLAFPGIPTVT